MHPAVREMLRASFAPALTFLALFFIPTIDRLMASSLDAGCMTAFHYGERPVVALETLVLSGPLLIMYYHWANVNAAQGVDAVLHSVPEMISLLGFVFIPISVGGAMLSHPIISILFGRGAFTAVEASAVVFAVLWFSQIFNFMIVALVRLMLIFKLTRIQFILSVGIMILNTVLNFALIGSLGLLGIVLSTLLSRIIITVGAFVFLKRYQPTVSYAPVMRGLASTLVAIVVMIAVVFGLQQVFGAALYQSYGLIAQIASLIIVAVIGALAYVMAALIIRHPDLLALLHIVGQTRYGFVLQRFGLVAKSE
jgi:putative peptidoglycan lipid II flippase